MLVYILLGMIALLILTLYLSLTKQSVIQELKNLNQELMLQNRELLNRLQAPDVRTFQALQTSLSPIPETDYISRDDESEAARVRSVSGIGELLAPEEDVKRDILRDFGLDYDDIPR